MGERGSLEAIHKSLSITLILYQLTIHFANTGTELDNSHYIKTQTTFNNSSFKDYKIPKGNSTIYFSYRSMVKILTENNR